MTKILSLDGGGVRGIVTATWLNKLQQKVNNPNGIGHSFDYIAGTSTGSILAAALSLGIEPDEIINLYKNRGGDIFPGRWERFYDRFTRTFTEGFSAPKYSDEGLEKVLKDVFGKKKLGDVAIPTLIVSYDTINREPIIFKSWKDSHKNLPIWAICKSSSSAPTYFPAHVMNVEGKQRALIDGGVVANNPSACILAEVLRIVDSTASNASLLKKIYLTSLGTGQLTRKIDAESAKKWGAIQWAIPIIDVLFDGSTDAVDYIVKNILEVNHYSRLQIDLTPGKGMDDLDDASLTNLNALENAALEYIKNSGKIIFDDLVKSLTK